MLKISFHILFVFNRRTNEMNKPKRTARLLLTNQKIRQQDLGIEIQVSMYA